MKTVVLFCQEKSIYKTLKGRNRVALCDVYDKNRDALTYSGRAAAIHHPPCRLWSRLREFSTADHYEKYFAIWSVRKVQSDGGVLEHPMGSLLFKVMNLPKPGESDEYGFTLELDQYHFGHPYRKRTWLYIVGLPVDHWALTYKKIPGEPKYQMSGESDAVPRYFRDASPKKFAKFLVKICAQINNLKYEKSIQRNNQSVIGIEPFRATGT